jgi:membrane-bound inhibitor of C-type lysozyme
MHRYAIILLVLIAACGGEPAPAPIPEALRPHPARYICADGYAFVASVHPDAAQLRLPDGEEMEIERVESASGAKYAGGDVVFWSKGTGETQEVVIEVDGTRHTDCRP